MDADTPPAELVALDDIMDPGIFRDPAMLQKIREALLAGQLVMVQNAARLEVAERMYECLDRLEDWPVQEGYSEHFHYHHHNLYDRSRFPPDLTWCESVFSSRQTVDFIQRLSGRDCSGETKCFASLYLPGDHSLPHTDAYANQGLSRQVTFIWYLAKNWRSTWGGEFFWCSGNQYVTPAFNTLLLFLVTNASFHFVTQVTPFARGKRLAITGWWTGPGDPGAPAT